MDLQGFFDVMQQELIESRSPEIKEAKKVLVSTMEESYRPTIAYHQSEIRGLLTETNGATINAATIAFHESRIAYYQS